MGFNGVLQDFWWTWSFRQASIQPPNLKRIKIQISRTKEPFSNEPFDLQTVASPGGTYDILDANNYIPVKATPLRIPLTLNWKITGGQALTVNPDWNPAYGGDNTALVVFTARIMLGPASIGV